MTIATPLEGTPTPKDLRRFWEKVDKNGPNGCWLWTGATSNGRVPGLPAYGAFYWRGKTWRAHRFSWFISHKENPGEAIDHLCHVTKCVNPAHLESVSHAENSGRTKQALSNICIKGHFLEGENLYIIPATGQRQCRECYREYDRKRYQTKYKEEKAKKTNDSTMRDFNADRKLDEEKVKRIRSMYAQGLASQRELARSFMVSQPMIGMIVRRETWKEVE